MRENRICLFDNYRFALILLVVIGHFINPYTAKSNFFFSAVIFISSFHMPAFIFLSGLFFRSKDLGAKVVGYLFIGLLYKICFFTIQMMRNGSASILFLAEGNRPWFMFVLAIYFVVSYMLQDLEKRVILVFSLILGCFAGYDPNINDTLCLSRAIAFYPFFVAGQLCGTECLEGYQRRLWIKALAMAIVLGWACVCLWQRDKLTVFLRLFAGKYSYNEQLLPWGGAYRLLCYAISALLIVAVLFIMPARRLPVVTVQGTRTLQIYFWHGIIQWLLGTVGVTAGLTAGGKIRWLILAVAVTFLTGTKLFSFPTQTILHTIRKRAVNRVVSS